MSRSNDLDGSADNAKLRFGARGADAPIRSNVGGNRQLLDLANCGRPVLGYAASCADDDGDEDIVQLGWGMHDPGHRDAICDIWLTLGAGLDGIPVGTSKATAGAACLPSREDEAKSVFIGRRDTGPIPVGLLPSRYAILRAGMNIAGQLVERPRAYGFNFQRQFSFEREASDQKDCLAIALVICTLIDHEEGLDAPVAGHPYLFAKLAQDGVMLAFAGAGCATWQIPPTGIALLEQNEPVLLVQADRASAGRTGLRDRPRCFPEALKRPECNSGEYGRGAGPLDQDHRLYLARATSRVIAATTASQLMVRLAT